MKSFLETNRYYYGTQEEAYYTHKDSSVKDVIPDEYTFMAKTCYKDINPDEWDKQTVLHKIPFQVKELKVFDDKEDDFVTILSDFKFRDKDGKLTLSSCDDEFDYDLSFDRDMSEEEIEHILNNFTPLTDIKEIETFQAQRKSYEEQLSEMEAKHDDMMSGGH